MPLPPLPFLLCDSFCLKNTLLMFPCGIPFDCCGSGRSWCDEEFKNPEQAELAFAPWLRRKGAQDEAFPGEELPRPLPTFAALTRFSLWCASAGGSCRAARESTAVSRPWPHEYDHANQQWIFSMSSDFLCFCTIGSYNTWVKIMIFKVPPQTTPARGCAVADNINSGEVLWPESLTEAGQNWNNCRAGINLSERKEPVA